jgi:hypothetical protein
MAVLATIGALWLGMVLAVSFLETPLKFRAPGVTLEIGLGIGRVVFHALNVVEFALALVLAGTIGSSLFGDPDGADVSVAIAVGVCGVVLIVQRFLLRPVLDRRLDARVRGEVLPASHHHVVYIVLEAVKVLALITLCVLATTTGAH